MKHEVHVTLPVIGAEHFIDIVIAAYILKNPGYCFENECFTVTSRKFPGIMRVDLTEKTARLSLTRPELKQETDRGHVVLRPGANGVCTFVPVWDWARKNI